GHDVMRQRRCRPASPPPASKPIPARAPLVQGTATRRRRGLASRALLLPRFRLGRMAATGAYRRACPAAHPGRSAACSEESVEPMPGLLERYGTVAAGLALIAVFVLFAPNFATTAN